MKQKPPFKTSYPREGYLSPRSDQQSELVMNKSVSTQLINEQSHRAFWEVKVASFAQCAIGGNQHLRSLDSGQGSATRAHQVFLSSEDLNIESDSKTDRLKENINQKPKNTKDKLEVLLRNEKFIKLKTPVGEMVQPGIGIAYRGKIDRSEFPMTALDTNDFNKRLRFDQLKKTKLEEMCHWKQKDQKGIKKTTYIKEIQKKNDHILSVADKDKLEKLEVYTDRFPLLEPRKQINKFRIIIHMAANQIIRSKLFGNIVITVIGLNSAVMMLQDPTSEPSQIFNVAENIFTTLYSIEMIIKIIGMGFVFNKGAYLRDPWNILDFVIVVSSYPSYFQDPNAADSSEGGLKISGLRAFRVMRPLRTISSVKGLKVLMQALFQAMPLLGNTIAILVFFFAIYAIAGTNLFSGQLKRRCVNIQGGMIDPSNEEPLCGGSEVCVGGFFCGKTNDNPNHGTTNFDNVMYSLLAVFQTTTLEGWSDIQKQLQKTYNYNIWIYFMTLVFIGAFFLLNLTLAVINSEFTKAHKEHVQEEQAHKVHKSGPTNFNSEMEEALNKKDEMSIAQFITARIYAKKMIEFLRMRQRQKKVENEMLSQIKEKKAVQAQAKRNTQQQTNKNARAPTMGNGKGLSIPGAKDVIFEEAAEHHDEQSEQEQLEKDIQEFLKNSRMHMQKQSHLGKVLVKSELFNNREKEGGMPTMKGNIGPSSKFIIEANNDYSQQQKKLFSKMADEFAIEKVIPNNQGSVIEHDEVNYSNRSFKLSLHKDDVTGSFNGSIHNHSVVDRNNMVLEIPGLKQTGEESSGLVTSDSNFELAGRDVEIFDPSNLRKKRDVKRDVSKTFKKLLKQNNKRDNTYNKKKHEVQSNESTKFGGSYKDYFINPDIETKFVKKGGVKLGKKNFKEDEADNSFVREDKDTVNPVFRQDKPVDMKYLQEYISTKRPKDPFKDLDPLSQKVDITANLAYHGTSNNDVFILRIQDQNENQPLEENNFLKLPPEKEKVQDPDFVDNSTLKPQFKPYQGKVVYEINNEVSSEDSDVNEDALFAQEQPYDTTAGIAFKEMLRQLPTGELAKRSDIMITSTLSISMFPKDKRIIMQKKRAHMKVKEIREYIDEKNAFNSLAKELNYATPQMRDKDKHFTDAYTTSFINKKKQPYTSKTLISFKEKVKKLNSNIKNQKEKDENIQKQEKLRHEQLKRAVAKKGVPKWDKEMAMKLLKGNFHDVEEDEEESNQPVSFDANKSVYAKNREDLKTQHQLENFEKEIKDILKSYDHQRIKFNDEIPIEIKKQFNLPEKMGIYEINFEKIKLQDFSLKKQKPQWSGQDVLPTHLNPTKSQYIIDHINNIRTWPSGIFGIWKRLRFLLRILVKSTFFDSFMTFAVLCNTITLSVDHYGINVQTKDLLDKFNSYFTWIFIVEMSFKLTAIGISKYLADKLNYLDGSVVMLSIFEMAMESILAGEGVSLDAFKTVRMFRTFRVFRIARLLRSLQSMQTIIGVMVRSYKSFIYITMLMFLFIFIFALLGMQTFGGTMNFEDGKPRGNYDDFGLAFITVFQILTMENWQAVLFDTMRSETNKFVIAIFYVAWIFLGNFILLNLFLAILLDSFLVEDEEDQNEEEEKDRLLKKKARKAEKRKKMDKNKLIMDLNSNKLKELAAQVNSETADIDVFFEKQRDLSENEDLEDLDEEQIVQIYKEEGLYSKDPEELAKIKNFIDIDCKMSVFLWDKESRFRIFMYKAWKSSYWEPAVQVLIAISSVQLAVDTYIPKTTSQTFDMIYNTIDKVFNIAFLLEMVVKIIAMGLIMDHGSYLRDSWNRLDFFIVCSSIIDMAAAGVEIPIVRILRMLRVLRPLRFINHNPDLKMVVVALLDSMGSIANVVVVICVVYLIFAILGVSFFGGTFFFCNIDIYRIQTEQECLFQLGQWKRYDFNFDDVGNAMNTLYVVASLEAWPDIMYQALDITGTELGPTKENSLISMVYFVIFILIGSFFFLNFFVGVLFLKFDNAQKEEKKGFTKDDLNWQDIQKLIIKAEPQYESTNVPSSVWRSYFHELVCSSKFERVITTSIVLNMVQMALLHENQTKQFSFFMDFTNYVFTIIFLIEAILKLIAFGGSYFNNSWNKFDFFVVVSSIFDVLLKLAQNLFQNDGDGGSGQFLEAAPQIARVMRVLRVTRVIRLASKAPGLQAILQTVSFSIAPLSNVVILLLLIYLMFSILGNFLFNEIMYGEVLDDIVNFQRFDKAFMLLFAVATGENWPIIMFDCSRTLEEGCIQGETCGSPPWSFVYFYMMVLVCSYVMLNLFVLVILEQFSKYYLPKENTISLFQNDLKAFMEVWKLFTQKKFKCKKIKEKELTSFFRELGKKGDYNTSLGFSKEFYDDAELNKHLLKMGIKSDNGCIYFNELLYRCMRRRYGNMKISKKMQIIELRTQYKIYQITLREKNVNASKKINNDDIYNNIVKKGNGVNPFLTVMNFRVSFKTWLKFARKRIRQEDLEAKGVEINSSDSSIEENKKPYSVTIEIEKHYSATSEEDEEEEMAKSVVKIGKGQGPMSRGGQGASMNGSQYNNPSSSRKVKKQVDPLKRFEAKMSARFKQLAAEQSMNQMNIKSPNTKPAQGLRKPPLGAQ